MQIEKHLEALKEVDRALDSALNDPEGLLGHQRRIASMTSLGMQQLVETYFHKLNIIKPGAQVKHEWFKMEERNLKNRLSPILTKNVNTIPRIAELLYLAGKIESDRNELLYGTPLKDDKELKEKIDTFLELKKIIVDETGDL